MVEIVWTSGFSSGNHRFQSHKAQQVYKCYTARLESDRVQSRKWWESGHVRYRTLLGLRIDWCGNTYTKLHTQLRIQTAILFIKIQRQLSYKMGRFISDSFCCVCFSRVHFLPAEIRFILRIESSALSGLRSKMKCSSLNDPMNFDRVGQKKIL